MHDGPTNPVKWRPMPKKVSFSGKSPYKRKGFQMMGSAFLLQGKVECVPCYEEGCDRNTKSFGTWVQDMSSADVMNTAKTMRIQSS